MYIKGVHGYRVYSEPVGTYPLGLTESRRIRRLKTQDRKEERRGTLNRKSSPTPAPLVFDSPLQLLSVGRVSSPTLHSGSSLSLSSLTLLQSPFPCVIFTTCVAHKIGCALHQLQSLLSNIWRMRKSMRKNSTAPRQRLWWINVWSSYKQR
ncbi:uncharacterized protein LOC116214450 [Punica granatum]|uniref:Uncharacterized protein LOC116214450 n=1 Tax=Punica granatum TaxID=22663 RepID=A0A6P8EGW3_PUNGR|nr:uncharacterized protein LOC116214450 [Punica granatum]